MHDFAGGGPRRTVVVGLAADPGLPSDVAEALAQRLPDQLTARVDDTVSWRVEVSSETLHLDDSGQLTALHEGEATLQDRGWDMMVGLTELPRRMGRRPLVLEVDTSASTAWVSVPALGGWRLRRHAEVAVIALIDRMMRRRQSAADSDGGAEVPAGLTQLTSLTQTSGADAQLVTGSMRGWGSRLRLLLGMVRVNRPWQLAARLDSSLAAAAATAAFGIFYASVWNMADTLSIRRLALINAMAITSMVWWLIYHNELWERSGARGGTSTQPRLYNATTVVTLVVGVACMYAILFSATFLAAMTVITGEYLEATLGHPVGVGEYLQIAWLASSMGTVAGALGSNFQSETAIRHAAYGRRQRARQE